MNNILGFGLLRPLQRDRKADFATAGDEALVRAAVGQILATRASSEVSQGELPWRPEFGARLHLLRHQRNDAVLQELARVYVVDALARWEPRVVVKAVEVERDAHDGDGNNILSITLHYSLINRNAPENQVLLPTIEQTVRIQ